MQRSYTLLLFLCLVGSTISAQQIWDNFEDIRQGTYDFISGTLIPYSENPDKTGANTSLVAASYTRNASEAFDVILLDAPVADLSDYISGAKQMSIAVYSPAAGKTVQITLENSATAEPQNFPVGRHSIYQTTTTVANSWEVLTFSLTEQPDMSVGNDGVNRLVLLFDPGNAAGDTYIFDDLNGPELADDPCDGATANPMILEDFECNQNLRYIFSHSGVNFRRVDNPDQNGNTSDKVATYTRNGGEMVDVIDLPKFMTELDRDFRIIKMDIEGAEWDILQVLLDHPVLQRSDTLFVETHERWDPERCIPLFDEMLDRAVAMDRPYINLYWV